jgi:hypothetical protein
MLGSAGDYAAMAYGGGGNTHDVMNMLGSGKAIDPSLKSYNLPYNGLPVG